MGKKSAETNWHKDERNQKKRILEDANHAELNNNKTEDEGLTKEGEHRDGGIQTKIENKRKKEKKMKKRELENDITKDEGSMKECDHTDGKSQTKPEYERSKEKKMKKSELKKNLSEEKGLAREHKNMDGESQTNLEHKRRKERELKHNMFGDEGLAREGEYVDRDSETKVEHEKKVKKRKKGELKDNVTEHERLAREGKLMDGESQTKIERERKKKKKRKRHERGDNEDVNVVVQKTPVKSLVSKGGYMDQDSQTKVEHGNNVKKRENGELKNNVSEDERLTREEEHMDGESQTKIEQKKKKKKNKRHERGDSENVNVSVQKTPVSKENGIERKYVLASSETTKSVQNRMDAQNEDVEGNRINNDKMEYDKKTVKQKKKKKEKDNKKCAPDEADGRSKDLSSKETPKKVSFSENVEVFPSLSDPENGSDQEDGLVQGKRFSPEEDEMVKQAVLEYVDQHALGEEGIKKVLRCMSHPEVKGCWKEIAAALPWRPVKSVYYRAHILFERDDKRGWTPEELQLVRDFQEKHGSDWRTLGDAIGKHRIHVKDAWRRLKVKNKKRGAWSQDEYQTLFDLVNKDLLAKVSEERKSKHGMLRDNISWEAISETLSTRSNAFCCVKWYNQLSSSMVAEGKWSDVDDYRLISAFVSLDATCVEDVDWDNVLEHRSGDVCLKRWNQMTRHLGKHGNMSFVEQVEVLAKRYCPDMLEAREIYDNKPKV